MLGLHRKDVLLGSIQPDFIGYPKFYLTPKEQNYHATIWGSTGSGKSFLLLNVFVQLFLQGKGVCLIDPHNDLSIDILRQLIGRGVFKKQDTYRRLVYIDWGSRQITPFNILEGADDEAYDSEFLNLKPTSATGKVLDMAYRVWPELEGSAPAFKQYFRAAMMCLIANKLPLGLLHEFLTDMKFRQSCYPAMKDQRILRTWETIDNMKEADRIALIGSAVRRADDMISDPITKYAFAAPDNYIKHREWMDSKTCFIHNLGRIPDPQTRHILGALLLVDIEQCLKSRIDLAYNDRPALHVLVDEWQLFADQEKTIAHTLSETRKYGGRLYLATQSLSVIGSNRLQGALEQCHLNIAMRLGNDSAQKQASNIASYDYSAVKEEAPTTGSHNMFTSLFEQEQQWVDELKNMKPRLAYIKLTAKPAVQIKTAEVSAPKVTQEQLDEVTTTYRSIYQRSVPQAVAKMSEIVMPNQRPKEPVYKMLYNRSDGGAT